MSKRQGIMFCYPFEEKRLAKWNPPYIVQPKLDGERCRGRSPNLLSSEENLFNFAVPHILWDYRKSFPYWLFEPDGELYCHGMSFEEIHSIVSRRINLHPDHEQIKFHIFDLIDLRNPHPQHIRLGDLNSLNLPDSFKLVKSIICYTLDDIMRAYDNILEQGYEGIIVRHIDNLYIERRSTFMMKFKPKKSDIYEVVGWKEEVSIKGEPKGRLGAIQCIGDDGTEFWVGSGLTDENRTVLWSYRNTLIGSNCKVQYQHITSGRGVPRFPIFLSIEERSPEVNPFLI